MYRTKMEEIADMLTGEDEQDIIGAATGVQDGMPDAGPPPTVDGYDDEPMGPMQGERPRTDQEQQYERAISAYKPGMYKEGGVVRHTPQQFGQMGDPVTDDEGPLTPLETEAEIDKINASPGGMEKRIAQHTIGRYDPQRQAGYDSYVADSTRNRDDERSAQQARARTNRADIADRESRTAQKMSDYNSMLGGGGGGAVGDDGRLPQVNRIGGIGFVRGRYRPFTEDEAAGADLKRANAEYIRSKPDAEYGKQGMKGEELRIRELLGRANVDQKTIAAMLAAVGKKETNEVRREANEIRRTAGESNAKFREEGQRLTKTYQAAKIKDMQAGNTIESDKFNMQAKSRLATLIKIIKAKEAAAAYDPWFGSPDPGKKDTLYDPATGKLGDETTVGDYDEKVSEIRNIIGLLTERGALDIEDEDEAKLIARLTGKQYRSE